MLILLHAIESKLGLPKIWIGSVTDQKFSHSYKEVFASEVQLRSVLLEGDSSIDLNIVVNW